VPIPALPESHAMALLNTCFNSLTSPKAIGKLEDVIHSYRKERVL
jgi:hypothetical protein